MVNDRTTSDIDKHRYRKIKKTLSKTVLSMPINDRTMSDIDEYRSPQTNKEDAIKL